MGKGDRKHKGGSKHQQNKSDDSKRKLKYQREQGDYLQHNPKKSNNLRISGHKEIEINVKVKIYNTITLPTITYATENWTIKSEHEGKIEGMEMIYIRKVTGRRGRPRKSWLDQIEQGKRREKSITELKEIARDRKEWKIWITEEPGPHQQSDA
ncbi:hypothetical protein FQA39_LY09217 [Lamprigera yunnana]|nr:hypothetical protein FQA39_LY09217 [Lamprigera yunnana]